MTWMQLKANAFRVLRAMRKRRGSTAIAILATVATFAFTSIFIARTDSLTIDPPVIGEQITQPIKADDFRPPECSSLSGLSLVISSGQEIGPDPALVLATSGATEIKGGSGNDCLVGGAGTTIIDGGEGTDICVGQPGTTYTRCE